MEQCSGCIQQQIRENFSIAATKRSGDKDGTVIGVYNYLHKPMKNKIRLMWIEHC